MHCIGADQLLQICLLNYAFFYGVWWCLGIRSLSMDRYRSRFVTTSFVGIRYNAGKQISPGRGIYLCIINIELQLKGNLLWRWNNNGSLYSDSVECHNWGRECWNLLASDPWLFTSFIRQRSERYIFITRGFISICLSISLIVHLSFISW